LADAQCDTDILRDAERVQPVLDQLDAERRLSRDGLFSERGIERGQCKRGGAADKYPTRISTSQPVFEARGRAAGDGRLDGAPSRDSDGGGGSLAWGPARDFDSRTVATIVPLVTRSVLYSQLDGRKRLAPLKPV